MNLQKDEHYCCDHLVKEHTTVRHIFYTCSICSRIVKLRNSELSKLHDNE
jgi:hypothetical protein